MENKLINVLTRWPGHDSVPDSLRWIATLLDQLDVNKDRAQGTVGYLKQLADRLDEAVAEVKAAGPEVFVKVCSLSVSPMDEVELAMAVRFGGDVDWFILSFYGRSPEDANARQPLRDLPMEEIQTYVQNARQWAERHGYSFELDELVESIVTPQEQVS